MTTPKQTVGDSGLVRVLGVRALAATAFNIMIGGGIFVLPAVVAAGLGSAAPAAYVVCALAMALIVLCFAEAGSRVSLTGGPYAYVEVALGPFVGFLAGVLLWLVGSFATAAVASAFTGAAGVFWPVLATGAPRALVLIAMFGTLAAVNIRGVREGTRLIEVVTVAKLLPLVLFILVGMFFVRGENVRMDLSAGIPGLGRTAIVLIFAFAGIETALVPSGEVRDPARTVPRALFIAMGGVVALYIALQLVAQGILGVSALATATAAPLATAASRAVGPAGGFLIAAGTVVSMFGYVSGMTLATPRALFAFGRDGVLPAKVAAVHRVYRTPYVAIALQSVIACTLAITGGFTGLAILANVSVLILYLLCCIAAWELRRRDVRAGGIPFRVPGGPVVPVLAIAVIVWLLTSATAREFGTVAIALAAAAVLFLLSRLRRRAAAPSVPLAPP